jgi:hypothetical protein
MIRCKYVHYEKGISVKDTVLLKISFDELLNFSGERKTLKRRIVYHLKKAVFWIRDILVRIPGCGSGSCSFHQ